MDAIYVNGTGVDPFNCSKKKVHVLFMKNVHEEKNVGRTRPRCNLQTFFWKGIKMVKLPHNLSNMPTTENKSSTSKGSSSTSNEKSHTKEQILEQRRFRNIESAKRIRDCFKNQNKWIQVHLLENKDRMEKLENA